jgi:hypothetical protein
MVEVQSVHGKAEEHGQYRINSVDRMIEYILPMNQKDAETEEERRYSKMQVCPRA